MSMSMSSLTSRSILALLPILGAAPVDADSGLPPSKESFLSPTRRFELIVDLASIRPLKCIENVLVTRIIVFASLYREKSSPRQMEIRLRPTFLFSSWLHRFHHEFSA